MIALYPFISGNSRRNPCYFTTYSSFLPEIYTEGLYADVAKYKAEFDGRTGFFGYYDFDLWDWGMLHGDCGVFVALLLYYDTTRTSEKRYL